MSAVAALKPASPAQAAVAGYVEATTDTAVLGWAWVPGHGAPLSVELRLGEAVLSEAVAGELRDDLARSGIGDGRHAFTLPVPETHRARLAELRVVARAPDGAAVPLGVPPAADGLTETLAKLGRGMEMLVGSQRVLHRNLQAALLARAEPGNTQGDPARMEEEIATLELFVVRLEQALTASRLAAAPVRTEPRWKLGTVAGMAGLALLLSAWSLFHVLPG